MGETLSKPVTEKHTSTFETSHIHVGCCAMQGWRKTMEDAHVAQLNLGGNKHHTFIGVFDGHNGNKIAKYCREHLLDELMLTPEYRSGSYDEAFKKAFGAIDSNLSKMSMLRSEGGTAAICVMLTQNEVICANAGDSRAVLYRGTRAIPLSIDHKPSAPGEKERILRAGGTVQSHRVDGNLAVSRAIGDFDYKENSELSWEEQIVTALPDVTRIDIKEEDAFVVVACDGVWDVLSNDDCCQLIHQSFKDTEDDIGLVCEAVLDRCLAPCIQGTGCDNMTIVIARFKPAFFCSER
ncbi:protein phosphatase 2C, putative [Trypanosoma equiperdum]|uniref:Protein phosphatase 2C-like, putative n=2 Tax=Trypanozoon TaxID=39700 RepID=Q38BA8_TRYB2|nr:protein phosphatase 2C-like, putative [Trypanosoma brucei brucei TREU927]EAN77912.1 protein phosphatase 2C-like, putative [Trypanosoma brucei brucei TREU927]SCU71391.1 protein phosphatase 2C, putative [Trypanosoma equiperdum]